MVATHPRKKGLLVLILPSVVAWELVEHNPMSTTAEPTCRCAAEGPCCCSMWHVMSVLPHPCSLTALFMLPHFSTFVTLRKVRGPKKKIARISGGGGGLLL